MVPMLWPCQPPQAVIDAVPTWTVTESPKGHWIISPPKQTPSEDPIEALRRDMARRPHYYGITDTGGQTPDDKAAAESAVGRWREDRRREESLLKSISDKVVADKAAASIPPPIRMSELTPQHSLEEQLRATAAHQEANPRGPGSPPWKALPQLPSCPPVTSTLARIVNIPWKEPPATPPANS